MVGSVVMGAVKKWPTGQALFELYAAAVVRDFGVFSRDDAELDQASIETSHHNLHASNIRAGLNRLVRQGDLIEAVETGTNIGSVQIVM